MGAEYILRVEEIHTSYGDREVLKGVSFEVRQGETKVFIGPSGTGKSTLLRCINQLTVPDQGRVFLNDEEVTNSGARINSFRQKIGMVFQNFYLFDEPTSALDPELTREVLFMEHGKIIERGSPAQVKDDPSFARMRAFIGTFGDLGAGS